MRCAGSLGRCAVYIASYSKIGSQHLLIRVAVYRSSVLQKDLSAFDVAMTSSKV